MSPLATGVVLAVLAFGMNPGRGVAASGAGVPAAADSAGTATGDAAAADSAGTATGDAAAADSAGTAHGDVAAPAAPPAEGAPPAGGPETASPTADRRYGKDWGGPPPGRVALQSMLVPGWGQVTNRAWLRSAGFFGAWAGAIGWGVALHQDVQDAEGRLHAALGTPDESYWESEVARLEDARNGKYWLGGLVILLSMADAYVDAHLHRFDERIDADVAVWPAGGVPVAGVVLRLPIPGPSAR